MKLIGRIAVWMIILGMVFMPLTAMALQDEVVPVSTSEYFDHSAQAWGKYIVWVRHYNRNADAFIDHTEPSWVMLHDITTGEEYNITEIDLVSDPSWFVLEPNIYGNHIIYKKKFSAGSQNYKLYMYNITSNETWHIDMSSYTFSGNDLAGGSGLSIYGDYITFSEYYNDGSNIRYHVHLLNYETMVHKVLLSTDSPTTMIVGVEMWDNYVVFTRRGLASSYETIAIYDMNTQKIASLNFSTTSNTMAGWSIYENYLAFSNGSWASWNGYVLDLDAINWSAGGWDTSTVPATKDFDWNDISGNITEVDVSNDYKATWLRMYGDWIGYSVADNGDMDSANVIVYNIRTERRTNITDNVMVQRAEDLYRDKFVWIDNQNSITNHNDARDTFDIYRTVTDLENIGSNIMGIVPIIIIILMIGAIVGAMKMFGSSGGGGML